MRLLSSLLLVLVAGLASPATAQAPEDGIHRLVLYISEDNEAKMSSALDIAANVSRHYSGIGELVEIEIVAFAGGLQLGRASGRERVCRDVEIPVVAVLIKKN